VTVLTPTQAEEAVARGAELLDLHEPGWESKITLETLNIESARSCVLGQVFGNYWNYDAWTRMGIPDVEKREWYGFTLEEKRSEGMKVLTAAWKGFVRRRRQR